MLLQKTPSIEELIVQILAQAGGHSPAEIHSRMLEKGYRYSQRGVYKELNKLEQEGIIYKYGKCFYLQLTWILNLLKFADQAYETSTTQYILKEALRTDSFKKVYRFKDLRRLDLFWIQNLMALHQLHQGEPLFLWCPYQWFQLVHSYAVESFYQASDQTSAKRYHIIGYDCYLSRRALKSLPKNGTYSFTESPFHKEQSTYYSLIASTVITIKLDDLITEHMSKLFQQVKHDTDLVHVDVGKLFHAKVRASLTIENNETKARKLRKKFTDFLGLT